MPRSTGLEHDSLEDSAAVRLEVAEEKEEEKEETQGQAKRQKLREVTEWDEDMPWVHPDNPAMWDGAI